MILRIGIALSGGLVAPGEGLGVVLFHPQSVLVHPAQITLRGGMTLIGGLALPGEGLGVVLFHP